MIFNSIKKLVTYGLETGLITEEDRIFTTNELLELLNLDEYEEPEETYTDVELESTLAEILDYACENGLLEDSIVYRDLFDTRIMGLLTPRPHEVIRTFQNLYAKSPKEATDAYYKFSQDTDYIRRYRIARDRKWVTSTPYGELDITINLSKP